MRRGVVFRRRSVEEKYRRKVEREWEGKMGIGE
jgi:hypothetical protein